MADVIRVQAEAFDPGQEAMAFAAAMPGAGALVTFTGIVRDRVADGASDAAPDGAGAPPAGGTVGQPEDVPDDAIGRKSGHGPDGAAGQGAAGAPDDRAGPESGGVSEDGAGLLAMEIEHYPGMTEARIAATLAEARARWPLIGLLVIHRHGRLAPGEPIMMVATAARHRAEAFQAAEFLMDYLKSRAPFWKREITRDGARWVEAKATDEAALSRWIPEG